MRLYCVHPDGVHLRENTTTLSNEDKFAGLAAYLWHECPSGVLEVFERELAAALELETDLVRQALTQVLVQWDGRRIGAVCGQTRSRQTYTFPRLLCPDCGASVAENWYVRHRRSGCKKGRHSDAGPKGAAGGR